jgi:hypothetical protein
MTEIERAAEAVQTCPTCAARPGKPCGSWWPGAVMVKRSKPHAPRIALARVCPVDVHGVACPQCSAGPGERCATTRGYDRAPHAARIAAANERT